MDTTTPTTASTSSSAASDPITVLYEIIHRAFERKDNYQEKFLPDPVLNDVLSEESVRATLKHLLYEKRKLRKPQEEPSEEPFIDKLTKFVREHATKIFAILVMSGASWHIQRFYSKRLGDEVLPVIQDHEKLSNVRSSRQCDYNQDQKLGDIFSAKGPGSDEQVSGWKPPQITRFCDLQWAFLAQVFDSGKFDHKLSSSVRLPYTTYEAPKTPDNQALVAEKHQNGNFGDVQDRCIHRDHLKFPGEATTCVDGRQNYRVAVKRLPLASDKYPLAKIHREIQTLRKIKRDFNSDHIIKAIASFEKGDDPVTYNVIFPWAERGNLSHFWKAEDRKRRTTDDGFTAFLCGILNQLAGLTGAVAELHSHNFRHGDIKPDNILCFPGTGGSDISVRLVLTDVGTSKQNLLSTQQRWVVNKVTTVQIWSARYAAPELNEVLDRESEQGLGVVSRLFDVWSLGCVFVEFLLWLVYGLDEMTRFQQQCREFFEKSLDGTTVVSEGVNKWLDHAKSQGYCQQNTALGRLMGLIVEKILVVEVEKLVKLHQRQQQPTPVPTPQGKPFWLKVLRKVGTKLTGLKKSRRRPTTQVQNQITEGVTDTQGSQPVAGYRVSAESAREQLDEIVEVLRKGTVSSAGEVQDKGMRGPP